LIQINAEQFFFDSKRALTGCACVPRNSPQHT
jgi:hypothetical protein